MIFDAHSEHLARPPRRPRESPEAPEGAFAGGAQRARPRPRPRVRTFRLAAGCAAAASVGVLLAPERASPLAPAPALGASPGVHAVAQQLAAPARRTRGRTAARSGPSSYP